MLWYVVGAAAMMILPSIALTVGHIRRQGGGSTVVPEKLALQLAKAVSKGTFEKAHFGTKPDVDLFPTKKTCPHCQNKDRKVWDSAKAVELLSDISELAQGIRQRRFCRGCLDQLSEIAKTRKERLPELDKKEPRRADIPFFLGAIFIPPLLIPATFIMAVRERGVYWLLFLFTTSFFLCLVALALAVLGLALR